MLSIRRAGSLTRLVGKNIMRSRQSLKPIRFEGELLPDWAQLLDMAASLSSVPESTRHWFSLFTSRTGVEDAQAIVSHCQVLRSGLQSRREYSVGCACIGFGRFRPSDDSCRLVVCAGDDDRDGHWCRDLCLARARDRRYLKRSRR
jgi:hypothetical protein